MVDFFILFFFENTLILDLAMLTSYPALHAELTFVLLVQVARVWLRVNAIEGLQHDLVIAVWCYTNVSENKALTYIQNISMKLVLKSKFLTRLF